MDRTDEYHDLMRNPESQAALSDFERRLSGHTILFVRGFLADLLGVPYFFDQKKYCGSLNGVEATIAKIDGEESPEANAKEIRNEIERIDPKRPIVLFTHSKGSLDTLHMLLDQRPPLERIAAWISVQGAFLGSPVADAVVTNDPLLGAAKEILEGPLKGSVKALTCLQTQRSAKLIADRNTDIRDLASGMHILCYGSAISGTTPTPLGISRDLMVLKAGLRNDGLMPIDNTFLPHASVIRDQEGGPDHAAPVMAGGCPAFFDRPRFCRTLIRMTL